MTRVTARPQNAFQTRLPRLERAEDARSGAGLSRAKLAAGLDRLGRPFSAP